MAGAPNTPVLGACVAPNRPAAGAAGDPPNGVAAFAGGPNAFVGFAAAPNIDVVDVAEGAPPKGLALVAGVVPNGAGTLSVLELCCGKPVTPRGADPAPEGVVVPGPSWTEGDGDRPNGVAGLANGEAFEKGEGAANGFDACEAGAPNGLLGAAITAVSREASGNGFAADSGCVLWVFVANGLGRDDSDDHARPVVAAVWGTRWDARVDGRKIDDNQLKMVGARQEAVRVWPNCRDGEWMAFVRTINVLELDRPIVVERLLNSSLDLGPTNGAFAYLHRP